MGFYERLRDLFIIIFAVHAPRLELYRVGDNKQAYLLSFCKANNKQTNNQIDKTRFVRETPCPPRYIRGPRFKVKVTVCVRFVLQFTVTSECFTFLLIHDIVLVSAPLFCC